LPQSGSPISDLIIDIFKKISKTDAEDVKEAKTGESTA
jgi:hypothetical protein